MKKLLMLSACLWALGSTPVLAQTGGGDVVVMRVYVYSGRIQIATTHGTGKTEITTQDLPVNLFKSQGLTAEFYHQAVAGLLQQGYLLKGMSGGDNQTTLVFSK